jgi:putative transcriptional regulator
MNSINPNYPATVKKDRRQLALGQEDLARELGVSFPTINRWENGQVKPSRPARAKLEGLEGFCEKMEAHGLLTLTGRNETGIV